jgi:hypothetical protein
VEELALTTEANWIIFNDADEVRTPPWADVSLRNALFHVYQSGFTAVNHTCLNFALTQDSFRTGLSLEQHLTWFNPERADLSRVNSWARLPGDPAELAWSGGHGVRFQGLRVFPYNFVIRHYPIRSVEQGRRKVFKERLPRFSVEERLRGWHAHYDHVRADALIQPTTDLLHFDEHFDEDYLIERLTGVGFELPVAAPTVRLRIIRALRKAGLLEPIVKLWWRLRGRAARSDR